MDFEEPSQISSTFLASGPEQIAGGQYPSNFGGRMLGKWSPKGAKLEPIEVPSPTSVVRWGCLKLSSCNSTQFNHHGPLSSFIHKALLVLVVLSDFLVGHITVLIGCIATDFAKIQCLAL